MKDTIKVGLMAVLDPRISPELEKQILADARLVERIRELGVEVVAPQKAMRYEEEAVEEVRRMQAEDACGIIYYTAWFLRANVIVGACQHSHLPAIVWTIPSMAYASMVGFGVTHGSLDEVGFKHEIVCDAWNERAKKKILTWIKACHIRHIVARSRYGHVGGKSLEMMTADADANQWRRKFGIDVGHEEQWTLIHEAEGIPEDRVKPLIEEYKQDFALINVSDEVLEKSARLYLAGYEMFKRNRWDFAGIKCQHEMVDNYLSPCLPIALWNDDGYVVACETDMNAALTMYVLYNLSGEPVMFSDIQYLDHDEKWARFLNCGTAATRLAGGRQNVELQPCPEVQASYDEKTGQYLCKGGACPHFILPPGEVTLARFGRIEGRYVVHVTTGESFEYPHDRNSLIGIGGVWPFAYVRIHQNIDRFVENLRAHHICIAFGNWEPELRALANLWDVEVLE
jgi:L-fucose isomerase